MKKKSVKKSMIDTPCQSNSDGVVEEHFSS